MSTRDELTALRVPEQPVLSIEGDRVAFVLQTVDRDTDSYSRRVAVVAATGDEPALVWSRGPCDASPTWVRDRLRFLRTGESSTTVCESNGPGLLDVRAELAGHLLLPRWSSDGEQLALVRPAAQTGWEVHVWDAVNGERRIASLDHNVLDLAWSPNGQELAVVVPFGDDPDVTDVTAVRLLDVDRAQEPRWVGSTSGHVATVGFTADGVAVGVGRTDTDVGIAHLLVDRQRGHRKVAGEVAGSVRRVVPGCSGSEMLAMERHGPTTRLVAIDLVSKAWSPLTSGGTDVLEVAPATRSGTVAAVIRTAETPGEIVLIDVVTGARREVGVGVRGDGEIQRHPRSWTMPDGRRVEGWIVTDGGDRSRPGPLLLDLHVGPHTSWTGTLEQAYLYHDELARRGWTIVLPNLSGSEGFGEPHLQRVIGQWGVADSREAWTIVDHLVTEGVADPTRLAVTGYSYGGFLANTMITQQARFAAAVVGNAMADLAASVSGSIMGEFIARFEIVASPQADPDVYARLSPSTRADEVRTPVLVMHATDDVVVPADQAERWHQALAAQGLPSQYVPIVAADHDFLFSGRPSQRDLYHDRLIAWLERFVPAAPTKEST